MSRKPRKRRTKNRVLNSPQSLATEEVRRRPVAIPVLPKQEPVVKAQGMTAEIERQQRRLASDMRRSLIAGGIALVVLIVVCVLVR